jgi:UPF0271 protein
MNFPPVCCDDTNQNMNREVRNQVFSDAARLSERWELSLFDIYGHANDNMFKLPIADRRMLSKSGQKNGNQESMVDQINLNADMGEGFGAYNIGNDDALLKIVRSANVACGFHAGDPNVMHHLVTRAKEEGVSIGAHPGFNDLWGFGRRRIDMNPRDLEYAVAYQIGALQAVASYAGESVTHLKAHGALNNIAAEDIDIAMAIGRAIKTVDSTIIYVALAGSEMERAAEKLGLPLAREGFADRLYDDDGNLTSRKLEGAVIKDPAVATEHVIRMARDGEIISRNGKSVSRKVDTICVHGDEPTAVLVAQAVRDGLQEAGIDVVPLTEMGIT